MAKTPEELQAEWSGTPRDWYSIYQWKSLANSTYSETVAGLILNEFEQIRLVTNELRQQEFRVSDHRGQARLQTEITQFTEKRFVRAMFNAKTAPLLGAVLDYEVPLKANQASRHGDIDLLCKRDNQLVAVEAKQLNSTESLLKAVLQVFVYTSLVEQVKVSFTSSFGLPDSITLTPAVLTFDAAESGRQLRMRNDFPMTLRLLERLNNELSGPAIEFFTVTNAAPDILRCLCTRPFDAKSSLIVFRDDFSPSIEQIILP